VGDDTLIGGAGRDQISGMDGHDTLYGGGGKDALWGGGGRDTLIGGAEADRLYGGEGNDWLFGDAGADTLDGGAGDDTYVFQKGDGRDLISDSPESRCGRKAERGRDTVRFGAGIVKTDVALFEGGGLLQLQYGEDDVLEVLNPRNPRMKVERFELSDGSFLTDLDVNRVIQEMSAYAAQEGICLQSPEDVRRNDALMTIVAGAWRQA
jgi:Ca2+-binding RTX toxin-like protein